MRTLLNRVRRAAALAASTLVAASLVLVPGAAAQAQPASCLIVDYQVYVWSDTPDSGGFTAQVTLTNTCSEPVDDWVLELPLPAGQQVLQAWPSVIVKFQIVVSPQPWNPPVVPGGSTTFGFTGIWFGAYQDPLSCTINGVPCDVP